MHERTSVATKRLHARAVGVHVNNEYKPNDKICEGMQFFEVYWNDTVCDFRQIRTVASAFYRAVGYSPPYYLLLVLYIIII